MSARFHWLVAFIATAQCMCCSVRHAALQHERAHDGIDHAPELRQQPVAHQLEDESAVVLGRRLEQLFAMRPQTLECVSLVPLHEPAIAGHVGGKDGGEMALSAFFNHGGPPAEEAPAEICMEAIPESPSRTPAGGVKAVAIARTRACYWGSGKPRRSLHPDGRHGGWPASL